MKGGLALIHISENSKISLAKTFTELAIQSNLFIASNNSEDTAQQISKFFNTIVDTIGETTISDN